MAGEGERTGAELYISARCVALRLPRLKNLLCGIVSGKAGTAACRNKSPQLMTSSWSSNTRTRQNTLPGFQLKFPMIGFPRPKSAKKKRPATPSAKECHDVEKQRTRGSTEHVVRATTVDIEMSMYGEKTHRVTITRSDSTMEESSRLTSLPTGDRKHDSAHLMVWAATVSLLH